MPNQLLVVGLDGTDRSHDALRFAIAEARLRRGSVEAITAWNADQGTDGFEKAERIQHEARTAVLGDHDGELCRVGEVAVVPEGEMAGCRSSEGRLGVGPVAGSRRRIPGMPDGQVSG